ncbi:hypothetical protein SELMODRAFT_158239 [Selaginella moellendorffii]|uniref:Uncharacterized protein n=1 Tax=Selaginella moellendorffii TaxID=88036 RepID=D8STX1_SELML|nr:5-amino-6-(5-phospho-D-ribitylamino)uracil phosphatase, chloroplastic [Selaginella moellendorffii]EFJ12148.1 hypothetical protein SELMODRAFT_158239 [Selaginella moellendorffii]|eukprot:XP_002986818.1 5-amino-6-(5-phospho-D-ribitylamino)uracil phosphatase, chloroplastic [Selaginella moellendorffii]
MEALSCLPASSSSRGRCGGACSSANPRIRSQWQMSLGRRPRHQVNFARSLCLDEEIGAEYGEGFSGYRPRAPLHVDVDYLNDRMQERGLQRIKYALKPDQAFGLIYSWDNVLADTRSVRLRAWERLAQEEGKIIGDDPEKRRSIVCNSAKRVLERLAWAEHGDDIWRLMNRLSEIYCEELSKVEAMAGLREWLAALYSAGVPCAVASTLDRISLLDALVRMGLDKYFQAVVTEEDGMDSIAHKFLSAAVKLDRPPAKCVVFEDDPRGITAAHNCTMKAVALIGPHPAYELTQADLAVSSFNELSIINLRRLFANKGSEFMDLQKQNVGKNVQRRRLTVDTF